MSSIYTKRDYYYYQIYIDGEDGERKRINKSLRTKDPDEARRLKKRWDSYYERKSNGYEEEVIDITHLIDKYQTHRRRLCRNDQLSPRPYPTNDHR